MCNGCGERHPTLHPAYGPPPSGAQESELSLLRRGKGGFALRNIEAEKWGELPAFDPPECDLLVAEECSRTCRRCHLHIEQQRALPSREAADDATIAPKCGPRSHMDPAVMFLEDN